MTDSPAPEALFARLCFDRHIMTRLADELRGRGYDVSTTEEAGLDTAADERQLAFATREGWHPVARREDVLDRGGPPLDFAGTVAPRTSPTRYTHTRGRIWQNAVAVIRSVR